ncbi:ammonia-forming cytochrome c nitrite reductase [Psychroserpens sp.]|uniref:ammonia-forming cytochrome c nitrite reductase n=1 Tax=Psychroserpens sp. TaxID=2020870 RepID=UPI001B04C6A8|nr:ammonia-forming cytochrome c nitrite reductase [Psychroserpens sp.]MBO6607741.1 ammonia-forming cytochrome c nitrite reductase [Psychroserpens sp.]MBO6630214.1 ammonia-forming cytochrome c nitrite reductase [Psychroserpens sp.]MBO6654732.1 ammonia-forming cytochrome c nitrite reductase [Psychroserpens sp.]MBO6682844.1 ammonia-forming cytochrome c nitrite reductase [Psychroserpens sp.]MBO6751099.1 ammonia-forming cytochrome c nitrite reductase [Psychroserpens sp.]
MKNKILFSVTIIVVFLLGLLASSIINRKSEAKYKYVPKVIIAENEPRNEIWGQNFPKEYQSSLRTADTSYVSYQGGSQMRDMLEEDPRLVILWAGYGFSKDYNQGRGHAYAIEDIHNTLRTGGPKGEGDGPMPATCWTCKSPDVPRLMNEKGITEFYSGKWADKGAEVVNSIGCADCHDPENMKLRITRPALVEAFDAMGKDINQVTHNEMRSLVCAQCHVEYYFNKNIPGKEGVPYLVFPWENGMTVEDMESYYDDIEFSDWTHALSKAPMLKAQHPGYEIFTTGVHADRGVSCADCHMPYKSEGGQKFTDHHIQSPLNNVSNACQVCHREESTKLIANVYERQQKAHENRLHLEDLLVKAHLEAKKCWDLGATEDQMDAILTDIRHAQWRWDYSAASHGGSFHSPVETARVIGGGIVVAQEARIKLARLLSALGYNEPIEMPDISTKEKAQEFIGLDIETLKAQKAEFKKTLLPKWLEEAKQREAGYDSKKVASASN